MEIYIVRHGETLWNKERRCQGTIDINLNEYGKELAIITGQALKDTHFDKIYSSPLSRAYETACLIRGDRDIPVITDDRLREICFGNMEGMCMDEMLKDPDSHFQHFFDQPELYVPDEKGESLEELCIRTRDFMEKVVLPEADKHTRIMIVGHGAMNKSIMCFVRGHGIDKFWSGGLQKNCNVMIVSYEDNQFTVLDEEKIYY